MKKLLLLLIATFLFQNVQAQQVQFGRRDFFGITTNTYGPMNTWFGGSPTTRANRHIHIYPLQGLGLIPTNAVINSVRYYRDVTSLSGANGVAGNLTATSSAPSLKIFVKNTVLTTLAAAVTWADTMASASNVYQGDPTTDVGTTSGWKKFSFSTPLPYTGNNLMLIEEYVQTSPTANTVVWSYDTTSVTPSGYAPAITTNLYTSQQNRYSAPVTSLPFPLTSTGSNVRRPTLQIDYEVLLPVKLISFQGKVAPKSNQLTWKTSFTKNVKQFIVQKSMDAKSWFDIGKVFAKDDSDGDIYHYNDEKIDRLAYYRLRIVDNDGKFEQSFAETIERDAKNSTFVAYPTIARDEILVSNQIEDVVKYELLDLNARIVRQFSLDNKSPYTLNISDLESGVYILKATNGVENAFEKIVKP